MVVGWFSWEESIFVRQHVLGILDVEVCSLYHLCEIGRGLWDIHDENNSIAEVSSKSRHAYIGGSVQGNCCRTSRKHLPSFRGRGFVHDCFSACNCPVVVTAVQAKRAVRQVTQARFCGDIGTLLRAVSDVMAADERRGRGSGDPNESAAGTNECASFSLSEVR